MLGGGASPAGAPRAAAAARCARRAADQAPVLLFELGELGEGGLEAERVDVAGVEAAEERLGQALERLAAEAAADEAADGLVRGVAPAGDDQVEAHAELARPGEEPALREREDAGGDGEDEALRQGVEDAALADVHLAVLLGGAHQAVAQAELPAELDGLRARGDEGVRAAVEHAPVAPLGEDVAAEARPRFEDGDGEGGAPRVPAGLEEAVCGGEAGDPPADDDDAVGAHGRLWGERGHGAAFRMMSPGVAMVEPSAPAVRDPCFAHRAPPTVRADCAGGAKPAFATRRQGGRSVLGCGVDARSRSSHPPGRAAARAPPRRRPLRDPRPPGPPRARAGAPGLRDHQAQHRQPGAVRLSHARDDAPRHAGEPRPGRGLLPPEGHLPRPRGGGDGHPGPRHPRGQRRRRVHGQRGLRADPDVHGRPPRPRRPGARPRPRLPALDGGRHPHRGPARPLPLPPGERLRPRPRRGRGPDHPPHPGAGPHQPQQPHRRRLPARDRGGPRAPRRAPRPDRLLRRDLRPHPLRGRGARPRRDPLRGHPLRHLRRALQGVPRLRAAHRLGLLQRAQAARRRLPRGARAARLAAPLLQRPRAVGGADRARGGAEHLRADRGDRAPRPAAPGDPPGGRAVGLPPRRPPAGRPLRLPLRRPAGRPPLRRRPLRHGAARARARPRRPGIELQRALYRPPEADPCSPTRRRWPRSSSGWSGCSPPGRPARRR